MHDTVGLHAVLACGPTRVPPLLTPDAERAAAGKRGFAVRAPRYTSIPFHDVWLFALPAAVVITTATHCGSRTRYAFHLLPYLLLCRVRGRHFRCALALPPPPDSGALVLVAVGHVRVLVTGNGFLPLCRAT